ncbi:hypothetical protein MHYP_G00251590 [Metynnis hypsauchen]
MFCSPVSAEDQPASPSAAGGSLSSEVRPHSSSGLGLEASAELRYELSIFRTLFGSHPQRYLSRASSATSEPTILAWHLNHRLCQASPAAAPPRQRGKHYRPLASASASCHSSAAVVMLAAARQDGMGDNKMVFISPALSAWP